MHVRTRVSTEYGPRERFGSRIYVRAEETPHEDRERAKTVFDRLGHPIARIAGRTDQRSRKKQSSETAPFRRLDNRHVYRWFEMKTSMDETKKTALPIPRLVQIRLFFLF